MIVSVEMPDSFARQMHLDGANGGRRALELLALEGYRSGELSRRQVGELLGLGFPDTECFLKDHHANIEMTVDEFRSGSDALEKLLAQ